MRSVNLFEQMDRTAYLNQPDVNMAYFAFRGVECDVWLVISLQAADRDNAIEYDVRSIRILRWNNIHSKRSLT